MTAIRLAVRNVFRHRMRSIVSLASIAFGSFSLIFVSGYFEDTFLKMRESYIRSHTGHFQIAREGHGAYGRKNPFDYLIENPADMIAAFDDLPGVTSVTPRLHFSGMASTGRTSVSFVGQGINPDIELMMPRGSRIPRRNDEDAFFGPTLLSGSGLRKDATDTVVLGRGLAAALNAKTGDVLTLTAATVSESINAWDVQVDGIFESSSKAFDDRMIRLPIGLAQELIRTGSVESLIVLLDRTEDTERVLPLIEATIREHGWPVEIRAWPEINDFYMKTKALFERMFLVLKLVIAVIVMLAIYNTVNMNVMERTSEIGTMRAVGRRRSDVAVTFILEGVVLGCLGGAVGVAGGGLITWAIGRVGILMPPPAGATMEWFSEPLVVPEALAFAFAFSLLVSVLSSILPAARAARLDIAEALRHNT